ncbi:MAG: type I DNA topoisomerase [Alphaproteobacteria bacterium]|nr:type I DNA topoisomerase [Alphaproteobacteria bacterium]
MKLVIVESPSKAKTINKYLGQDYQVLASFGHVRDLPAKNGSVLPDDDFSMIWEVGERSKKQLNEIIQAAKSADSLILATDPDREGEAISWHVLQVLKDKKALGSKPVQRVVFNEITKSAILEAMKHPREIDAPLVEAYLARRALDYLVGFSLSPVLWRKLPGARSAGRVQSVALRLICVRELEIESFVAREYWTVEGDFGLKDGLSLTARLTRLDGEKVEKFTIATATAAEAARARILTRDYSIKSVESKPAKRNPPPPFITSTLQQEAARKLGFSSARTMQVAQRLYEGFEIDGETTGIITYMRTDGVTMAGEAIAGAREMIAQEYGKEYVPQAPRVYTSKAKNAQEGHEAIRPTDMSRLPASLDKVLDKDQHRLYELIWKRAAASQMESAALERTTVEIESGDGLVGFRATGSVLLFDGFLRLYQEGADDDDAEDEDGGRLPKVAAKDPLSLKAVRPDQHFTEPPPRYSEASLVKKMEELGIGRPSTYASVLSVLRDRDYVTMDKNRFIPSDKGRLVTAFLESFFTRYVEYDFTADLEEQLDDVSAGKINWKQVLRDFWKDFNISVEGMSDLRVTQVLDALNEVLGPHVFPAREDGLAARQCPACAVGQLSLKVGKFGAFVGCSNYPECAFTRQMTANGDAGPADAGPILLGMDPDTGLPVTLRKGRFGLFLQLGEAVEKGDKPKRGPVPKDMPPEAIDLERALQLLSLPRPVGTHPETGKLIEAAIGPYGPYLRHDGKYANLTSTDEVFTIGLNHAVSVIADAKNKPQRRGNQALKELGVHPLDEAPLSVMNGRFGPYIKWNKVFATIPKSYDPQTISLEEAIELVNAKAARGPSVKKTKAGAKKASEKPAAKKAAAKKPAAKKPAAKKKPAKKVAAKKTPAKKTPDTEPAA